MLQALLAALFVALAIFLLTAPDRHFRRGSRVLRRVGAAAFLIAAAAAIASVVAS